MWAKLDRLISHRLRALVRKEFNQIKRDRRILASLIMPPLVQLVLFGTVMRPDVADLRLGIIDESHTQASRDLVAALTQSGSFRMGGAYESVDVLGQDLSKNTIDAGVVIPADFAADLIRGESPTVQVLLNAMNANTASMSQAYVRGVVENYNRTIDRPPVQMSPRAMQGQSGRRGAAVIHPTLLYNPGGETTWFLVTGLFGVLLIMNGSITASTTMVKEREAGTLEQLLMTPSGISEIIVSKITPPFLLLNITALVAIAVLRLYFNVPFQGSVLIIAVSAALCLFCGIGIGTAVATVTRSAQQAQLATFFITPPLMSLSGAMTPAEAMPAWMRPWTIFNPVYHFGIVTRAALIKGSGFIDLWPHLVALLLFALVLMSVSVWRFRQQLS